MDCSPPSLIAAASCMRCIPRGRLAEVSTSLMCQWANNLGPAICQHAVVDSWVTRVAANGGTAPTAAIYAALCDFMTGMDAAGLTSKMIALNPFVPGAASPAVAASDLIRARTPLIVGLGNDPWTNVGTTAFAASDLTVAGLKGTATDQTHGKALGTGIVPSTAYADALSAGLTLYNVSALNESSQDFGSNNSTGQQINLIISSFANNAFWDTWNGTVGQGRIQVANNLWTGFISGNRTSATATALYRANSSTVLPFASFASAATSGGTRPTFPISCFALATSGVPQFYTSKRFSFAAIHLGLTAAQVNSFYVLIQALRTALGGGYV